jgi:hypothetical protein
MLRFKVRDIQKMSAEQVEDLLDRDIVLSSDVRHSLLRRLRLAHEQKGKQNEVKRNPKSDRG